MSPFDDPDWTPAMARRDASDQVEDANAAARDEVASQRAEDWLDIYDDRTPTRAELEDDRYWLERERGAEWSA